MKVMNKWKVLKERKEEKVLYKEEDKMNIYEIKREYEVLSQYLEDNDLDKESFKEAFLNIEGSLSDKCENYVKLIKNLEGDIEAHKGEEKRLSEKRKAMENKVLRLKQTIYEVLKDMKLESLKAGTFNLRIQNNAPSVDILDQEVIPEEYKSYEVKLDKKGILEDLKLGKLVAGAEIKQSESLRIR